MKIKTKSRIDHREDLLRRVLEASRMSESNYWVRKYLGSFDANLHATLEAYEAMKPADRPDPAELASIAGNLDPWKGTDEPVIMYRKRKSSGKGHRLICKFGIKNRALQYLVRDVLIALLDLHPNQYATRGGVPAAIKHTKQALIDGHLWAVELDIKECYPSFDEEKLPSLLPLPKEVTDHVILSRWLNLSSGFSCIDDSPGDDHGGDSFTPISHLPRPTGLLQGSAVSPIVAEAMIAIALIAVPTLGVIIVYADNILLLAKTKSDRDSTIEALLAAFEAHPVGRLRLSPRRFAPGEPIEFLGHRLTLGEGDVRIEVSDSNKRKFEDRMESRLRSLAKTKRRKARRKALDDIKEDIQSWAASFKLCDDIQKIRSHWLARIHRGSKRARILSLRKRKTMSNTTYKTFKLHPDQKEIVEAALTHVKEKTGTRYDTVALELIFQQYMGTGFTAPVDGKSALLLEYKKAGDIGTFLEKVVGWVQEITGKEISVSYDE